MYKSKFQGTTQEVILPDFSDDDTTTVTKSRRVSFGTNFVKEFIVGSAVSAQCVSEYEQTFASSTDSSNPNSSHSALGSGIIGQNTFVLEDNHSSAHAIPSASTLESNGVENASKGPKFSRTICFNVDSPTADMEFTEGCISLAKNILDKKNKEMTVIIQAKPKTLKDDKQNKDNTKFFEGSQFDMSITQCFKTNDGRKSEKKFEEDETRVFNEIDNDMSITKCSKIFSNRYSNAINDDSDDVSDDSSKENKIPLSMIMHQLDNDNSDLENSLFNPEKSLIEVLNAHSLDMSLESDKLNINDSMDMTKEFCSSNAVETTLTYEEIRKIKSYVSVEKSKTEFRMTVQSKDSKSIMKEKINVKNDIIFNGQRTRNNESSEDEEIESNKNFKDNGVTNNENSEDEVMKSNENFEDDRIRLNKNNEEIKNNEILKDNEVINNENNEEEIINYENNKEEEMMTNNDNFEDEKMKIYNNNNFNYCEDEKIKSIKNNLNEDINSNENCEDKEVQYSESFEVEEMKSNKNCKGEEENHGNFEIRKNKTIENCENKEMKSYNNCEEEVMNSEACNSEEIKSKNIEFEKIDGNENLEDKIINNSQTIKEIRDNVLSTDQETKDNFASNNSENKNLEIDHFTFKEKINYEHPQKEERNVIELLQNSNSDSKEIYKETAFSSENIICDSSEKEERAVIIESMSIENSEQEKDIIEGSEDSLLSCSKKMNDKITEILGDSSICTQEEKKNEGNLEDQNRDWDISAEKKKENGNLELCNSMLSNHVKGIGNIDAKENNNEEFSKEKIEEEVIEFFDTNSPKSSQEEGRNKKVIENTDAERSLMPSATENKILEFVERMNESCERTENEMIEVENQEPPLKKIRYSQEIVEEKNTIVEADNNIKEAEEIDIKDPPFFDGKVIENIISQSTESNCSWSLYGHEYSSKNKMGKLLFRFNLMENYSMVTVELNVSAKNSLDSYSFVKTSYVNLVKDDRLRRKEYEPVLDFGFLQLKKYLEEEKNSVKTILHVSYFLDQMNAFTNKLNSYLEQIYSILTQYPSAKLEKSIISFRLFSFPLLFSAIISIDLTNFYRLSRLSLSFKYHFGRLDEKKIGDIFENCLKGENPLHEFVVNSTKCIIEMEKPSGYVSKRNHITLLPPELL